MTVWHRMLYSCTHIATEGVKGLNSSIIYWVCVAVQSDIFFQITSTVNQLFPVTDRQTDHAVSQTVLLLVQETCEVKNQKAIKVCSPPHYYRDDYSPNTKLTTQFSHTGIPQSRCRHVSFTGIHLIVDCKHRINIMMKVNKS